MKLTEEKIPILSCVNNNVLTGEIQEFLDRQISEKENQKEVLSSLPFFVGKNLQINYISNSIHERLIDTSNFVKAKKLLKNSPTTVGLLLLPKTIYPYFTHLEDYPDYEAKDYPINAILYSWITMDEHDSISNEYQLKDLQEHIKNGVKPPKGTTWEKKIKDLENEEKWGNDEDRELLILPIYNDGTTQATNKYELTSNDEVYGWDYSEQEGRSWYGKIHDYVMSFILFYNYTETETKVIHGIDSGEQRRIKLNGEKFINSSKNDIEIIDSTYFTKMIRTGEFGVRGHFRVQSHGIGNSETKIIFIEKYKKEGYTRGAKIDRKN
tara:strand:+ start:18060 stop:19031 length:972 start_codon:yes stop_codon:yes gene_type:complete